ncbi:MAG: hypothetical protein KAR57_08870 [Bacteroidales bacterium]|nr:hypothetical protein [Bacteroidales bacterium]
MINTLLAKGFNINITIEFFIIVLLFAYIIYLQLQLSKKNFLIRSYLDQFGKQKSKLAKTDIIRFLENLKNPGFSGVVTKDKLLDNRFSNFLFENDKEIKLFLHYTAKEKVAKTIIKEGFKFVNSFYKTAEYIYNDELYLIHRHHEHKQYGDFVIVICISKDKYNNYSEELARLRAKNIAVEQILTEAPPVIDENSDEVYILPKQFIKGYFNYIEGTIVENPDFDINYHSVAFNKNLEKIRSKNK